MTSHCHRSHTAINHVPGSFFRSTSCFFKPQILRQNRLKPGVRFYQVPSGLYQTDEVPGFPYPRFLYPSTSASSNDCAFHCKDGMEQGPASGRNEMWQADRRPLQYHRNHVIYSIDRGPYRHHQYLRHEGISSLPAYYFPNGFEIQPEPYIIFAGCFNHFSPFQNIMRSRFFNINMFPGLTGPNGSQGMPVIRCNY